MFGKLSWEAVPFHEPIVMVTIAMIALGGLALFAAITYFKKWTYLWTEWLTSVDHKKIGVMYIIVAMVMLLRGFADAIMMRTQLAMATEGSPGYLPPEHYDQIFTAHGVIMIIFMAMPFFTGLMNLAVPLQIGARDVAYPFLNSLSFWLLVSGVVLINLSLGQAGRLVRQELPAGRDRSGGLARLTVPGLQPGRTSTRDRQPGWVRPAPRRRARVRDRASGGRRPRSGGPRAWPGPRLHLLHRGQPELQAGDRAPRRLDRRGARPHRTHRYEGELTTWAHHPSAATRPTRSS